MRNGAIKGENEKSKWGVRTQSMRIHIQSIHFLTAWAWALPIVLINDDRWAKERWTIHHRMRNRVTLQKPQGRHRQLVLERSDGKVEVVSTRAGVLPSVRVVCCGKYEFLRR